MKNTKLNQQLDKNNQLLDYLITNKIEYTINGGIITVGGGLDLSHTGITELPDGLTVGGYLDLRGTSITSLHENLTVGGDFDLEGTSITSLPEGLTVGGYLDLSHTGITELPDGLVVGGWLDLSHTGITELPDGLVVGGRLDLIHTGITSLPDNLTVGGYLDLRGTSITSLPEGLTVGGYLDIRGTSITSLPESLTVGGSLYLRGTSITEEEAKRVNKNFSKEKLTWKNGKYRVIDGIFCEVVRTMKSCLKVKVGLDTQYIVFSNGVYSHGKTIKEAKADLIYKIGSRDTSEYEGMALDTVLSKAEAIKMYRVITGACETGTRHFVESLNNTKAKYSVAEIIELTKGQYGNGSLVEFFKKGKE